MQGCFARLRHALAAAPNGHALLEADGLKAIKAVFDASEHDGTRAEAARILVNLARLQDGARSPGGGGGCAWWVAGSTHAEPPPALAPRAAALQSLWPGRSRRTRPFRCWPSS